MRHEVPEGLSFSRELKLMKGVPLCDADNVFSVSGLYHIVQYIPILGQYFFGNEGYSIPLSDGTSKHNDALLTTFFLTIPLLPLKDLIFDRISCMNVKKALSISKTPRLYKCKYQLLR